MLPEEIKNMKKIAEKKNAKTHYTTDVIFYIVRSESPPFLFFFLRHLEQI